MYTHIHSNSIIRTQKVEMTQKSINDWMGEQMWYLQTMEYYAAIRRKAVLVHATTWVNLKNVMLSERQTGG